MKSICVLLFLVGVANCQQFCWQKRFMLSRGRVPQRQEDWEDCYHPCQQARPGYTKASECWDSLTHCEKRRVGDEWRCVLKSVDVKGMKIDLHSQYRPIATTTAAKTTTTKATTTKATTTKAPTTTKATTTSKATTTTQRPTTTKRPITYKRHLTTKRWYTTKRHTTTKRPTTTKKYFTTKRPTTTKQSYKVYGQRSILQRFANMFSRFGHSLTVIRKS